MKVYAVYRNADMTEGRGPMVLEKLFVSRTMAWTYANNQRGVMGRSAYRDHKALREQGFSRFIGDCTGWSCTSCNPYGAEWEVRQMDVVE